MSPKPKDGGAARIPAEVFSLAEMLCDEMRARGWTTDDVAARMDGDFGIDALIVCMTMAVQEDGLLFDDSTLARLAVAFDVSPQYFRNIDNAWRAHPESRQPFTAPEDIYGPRSTAMLSARGGQTQ